MSDTQATFMQLALNGDVLPEEIDDFVDEWHDGASELELYEFLGMSEPEYSLWASDPDMLDIIIAARHRHQSLLKAVNDNLLEVDRIAARSDRSWKVAMLRKWINQQSEQFARH